MKGKLSFDRLRDLLLFGCSLLCAQGISATTSLANDSVAANPQKLVLIQSLSQQLRDEYHFNCDNKGYLAKSLDEKQAENCVMAIGQLIRENKIKVPNVQTMLVQKSNDSYGRSQLTKNATLVYDRYYEQYKIEISDDHTIQGIRKAAESFNAGYNQGAQPRSLASFQAFAHQFDQLRALSFNDRVCRFYYPGTHKFVGQIYEDLDGRQHVEFSEGAAKTPVGAFNTIADKMIVEMEAHFAGEGSYCKEVDSTDKALAYYDMTVRHLVSTHEISGSSAGLDPGIVASIKKGDTSISTGGAPLANVAGAAR